MKILVISASMRGNSQSLKVSKWLVEHANTLGLSPSLLDLHQTKLPMYDDGETEAENKEAVLKMINDADGFVFVSPEWNGTMSHGLVNLLHYVGKELAHKPVMLAGVSSGRGGHYPLMQMRNMVYKNNHFVISPEALLVQDCKNMLNDHEMNDDVPDISVKKRADYGLKILAQYAKSLKQVRESGVVDHESFANGV